MTQHTNYERRIAQQSFIEGALCGLIFAVLAVVFFIEPAAGFICGG